jgi:integrase
MHGLPIGKAHETDPKSDRKNAVPSQKEREKTMSVFKRRGSPFYQYDFLFEGRRFRGSTKFSNRIAAQRAVDVLRTRLAQSRAGIAERKPVPLFKNFADDFLERVKPELRPNTSRGYRISIACLKDRFGTKALDEIAADEIEKFKQTRLEKGRSSSTVNRDLACLRRVLLFAVKMEILGTTPFIAHRVKFLKESGRERILNFDEERRYLAVACPSLRDVGTLMVEMGLRPGEACSIRGDDVHLYATPPFLHIPSGKTQNAVRDVPITARAMDVLKPRIAKAQKEKGKYIFPFRIGTGSDWTMPMHELGPAHRRALLASKITLTFRIYDLRHTYGTRAIESGTDPLTLMRLMGHADLKTTLRYVHLSKRHLSDAQIRIERYRAEREIAEAEARGNTSATLQ